MPLERALAGEHARSLEEQLDALTAGELLDGAAVAPHQTTCFPKYMFSIIAMGENRIEISSARLRPWRQRHESLPTD
jgi:hypothetical protein